MISEITRFVASAGITVPVPVIVTESVPMGVFCALKAVMVMVFAPGPIGTDARHVFVFSHVTASGCVAPANRISFTSTQACPVIVTLGVGAEPSGVVMLK